MDCQDLLAIVNQYVDGEVDPKVCEHFEQHLAGCNPCQVVVDTVRRTITLYKGAEVYEMPLAFKQRLHATLKERWKQTMGTEPE